MVQDNMVQENMVTIARDYANMHIPIASSSTSAPAKRGLFERLMRKQKRNDPLAKSKDPAVPTATSSDGSPRGVAVHSQSAHGSKSSSKTSKTFSIKEQSNERARKNGTENVQPSAESENSEKAQSSVHTELENGKEESKVQERSKSQRSKSLENANNQSKAWEGVKVSRRKLLAVWLQASSVARAR